MIVVTAAVDATKITIVMAVICCFFFRGAMWKGKPQSGIEEAQLRIG